MADQIPDDTGAVSRAAVATPKAARYLQQLCKHFLHKCPVIFDARTGRISFSVGLCRLGAEADTLTLALAAPDDDRLVLLQKVVESHLRRFAFRENLQVDWQHP